MKKKENVQELIQFMKMDAPFSIQEWNDRRQEAKEYFSQKCISQMDASGVIKSFHLTHL